MSSLSPTSTNHEIFNYDKSEEEAVNGFVAGLAGSALRDEPDFHIASKKRTIRLSANSGSYEEPDYRTSHPSITEEATSEVSDDECDELSEFEMKLSDGSHYPSRFSLLNISDVTKDSETTLEVTNCSTVDATLDHNSLEISVRREEEEEKKEEEKKEKVEEKEKEKVEEEEDGCVREDSVFSPAASSSFGEFHERKEVRSSSDSSVDSFGDFDDGPWIAPAPSSVTSSPQVTSSPHVTSSLVSRDEVEPTTDQCYEAPSPTSLILHSSPKKLLDNNFVWVQARSNVTKPSYTWDKLKLHSYLLGALSVRQPISLNRLKPAGLVSTPQKISSTSSCVSGSQVSSSSSSSSSSSPSPSSSSSSPDSPVSSSSLPVSAPISPCDVELGRLPSTSDSMSEGRKSEVSSPDIASHSEPVNRPSLTSIIHKKLTSHRRTHSSPIPALKPASPGTRSLSSSPSTAIRGITKSSSLESPLSPCSFDETHAGRGLSLLQLSDIQTMRHEMKSRVSELSATLITEFQYRGDADHSKEVKKAFVSAFLTAEEKKSKGQLSNRQKSLLPIVCNEHCPPTEILVLLTQLLNGLINDTPHTAELLKHYMYMLCRPCLEN